MPPSHPPPGEESQHDASMYPDVIMMWILDASYYCLVFCLHFWTSFDEEKSRTSILVTDVLWPRFLDGQGFLQPYVLSNWYFLQSFYGNSKFRFSNVLDHLFVFSQFCIGFIELDELAEFSPAWLNGCQKLSCVSHSQLTHWCNG